MQENDRGYKRKTLYIKKEFQFKFILKFCLILLAGVVISTGLLFFLSQETLTSSFENSRLVIKNTGLAILPAIIMTNLITLGIICIATIIVTLFVSHRIAGPMFRFEKDLERIMKGDLSVNINLRKKDQFFEVASTLNNMTQGINEKISKVNHRLDEILPMPNEITTCRECTKKVQELKDILTKEFSL